MRSCLFMMAVTGVAGIVGMPELRSAAIETGRILGTLLLAVFAVTIVLGLFVRRPM